MKKLLSLIFLLSSAAQADELALGLVTAHLMNPGGVAQKFKGCLNPSCEVIQNPVLAYRMVSLQPEDGYTSHNFLAGVNSVHQPMVGYFYSDGYRIDNHKLGIATGFYLQNNDKFRERKIQPFYIAESGNVGIVPIVGLEHQYRLTKKVYTNILMTPVIVNLGIGFGF